MQLTPQTSVLVFAMTAALWIATAGSAAADIGPCGLPDRRPACTILRPAIAEQPRDRAAVTGQQCVVVVGGLGSPTDGSDAEFFDAVVGDPPAPFDHRLVRFGVDRGTFDTTGAISRSGAELRSVIRSLSADCEGIHLLAHSMGGAVADRALSKGDPAGDGVTTYVALASPHNGATVARAVRPAVEADPVFAWSASALTRAAGLHDPTADAVRDLARVHAPSPVRGVAGVRLRMVTDELVLRRDNLDRRYDVREYLPLGLDQVEGHAGIVRNERVRRVVQGTIASGRVPPDDRTALERTEAGIASAAIDAAFATLEESARIALLAAALATRSATGPLATALSLIR